MSQNTNPQSENVSLSDLVGCAGAFAILIATVIGIVVFAQKVGWLLSICIGVPVGLLAWVALGLALLWKSGELANDINQFREALTEASDDVTYSCSNCRGILPSKDVLQCPHCGVGLSGIQCLECNYLGTEEEFVDDQCPRCGNLRDTSLLTVGESAATAILVSQTCEACGYAVFRGEHIVTGLCPRCGASLPKAKQSTPSNTNSPSRDLAPVKSLPVPALVTTQATQPQILEPVPSLTPSDDKTKAESKKPKKERSLEPDSLRTTELLSQIVMFYPSLAAGDDKNSLKARVISVDYEVHTFIKAVYDSLPYEDILGKDHVQAYRLLCDYCTSVRKDQLQNPVAEFWHLNARHWFAENSEDSVVPEVVGYVFTPIAMLTWAIYLIIWLVNWRIDWITPSVICGLECLFIPILITFLFALRSFIMRRSYQKIDPLP